MHNLSFLPAPAEIQMKAGNGVRLQPELVCAPGNFRATQLVKHLSRNNLRICPRDLLCCFTAFPEAV